MTRFSCQIVSYIKYEFGIIKGSFILIFHYFWKINEVSHDCIPLSRKNSFLTPLHKTLYTQHYTQTNTERV